MQSNFNVSADPNFVPLSDAEREERIQNVQRVTGAGIATAAVVTATVVASPPAQAGPIDDVTTMVTGLGALAGAALVVALAPMAISFAFKIIRRVMA